MAEGERGAINFLEVLNSVIEAVAMDHPHHSLWQIFALSNGSGKKTKGCYLVETDKARAAKGGHARAHTHTLLHSLPTYLPTRFAWTYPKNQTQETRSGDGKAHWGLHRIGLIRRKPLQRKGGLYSPIVLSIYNHLYIMG